MIVMTNKYNYILFIQQYIVIGNNTFNTSYYFGTLQLLPRLLLDVS